MDNPQTDRLCRHVEAGAAWSKTLSRRSCTVDSQCGTAPDLLAKRCHRCPSGDDPSAATGAIGYARRLFAIIGVPDRDNEKHLYLPKIWGGTQDDSKRRHCRWSVRRRT